VEKRTVSFTSKEVDLLERLELNIWLQYLARSWYSGRGITSSPPWLAPGEPTLLEHGLCAALEKFIPGDMLGHLLRR
jgi:hypothetical protein